MNTVRITLAIGAVLVATGLSATSGAPVQAAASAPIAVVSHAGSPLKAPSNTLPGLTAAADDGAKFVEVDVRWTRNDPGPAAFAAHDDDLAAASDCTGTVSTSWFSVLRACSYADYAPWSTDTRFAGRNADGTPKVPMMYVDEFMRVANERNFTLVLDVKAQPTRTQMDNFMSYVDRASNNPSGKLPMRQRIIWMAATPEELKLVKGWYPDLTYWLLDNPDPNYVRSCAWLSAIGTSAYAVPNYRVDAAKVAYWHSCNVNVMTWTTNTPAMDVPAEWQRVRDAGVDALVTNYVSEANALLNAGASLPTAIKRR